MSESPVYYTVRFRQGDREWTAQIWAGTGNEVHRALAYQWVLGRGRLPRDHVLEFDMERGDVNSWSARGAVMRVGAIEALPFNEGPPR